MIILTDQVYWYMPKRPVVQLKEDAEADIVIIGGGMAGLSAAVKFKEKGYSVIVLEKNFCGAGASGKSSGFITPDSEFSLHSLIKRYGENEARKLWEFVKAGVEAIRHNIIAYDIDCDFQVQDTVVVATSEKGLSENEAEHHARLSLGYESSFYTRQDLNAVVNSEGYFGGIRYGGTFGINGYRYLQSLKTALMEQGVKICEETPAIAIEPHKVKTPYGVVKAGTIVLCADRWIPDFNKLVYDIYHVQTFLIMSAPLTDKEVLAIFPDKPLMAWDTDLIYKYWRIAEDNRLLIGGSTILGTYSPWAQHDNYAMAYRLGAYFNDKYPQVRPVFEYMWPGLIGVSKDIMPLAGRDEHDSNLYYIGGAAGLPWAAALGGYAADVIAENRSDLDGYFSPYRHFTFGPTTQKILGRPLTFALSHLTSLESF